jgi:HupE / UreJ protein
LLGFAAVSLSLALASSPVEAHDLPINTVMNAFVKVEPHQAHLVVRVPLDLLRNVSFAMKETQYDLAASGPGTEEALRALADGFVLLENGAQLTPSNSVGRLSLPSNRSFDRYETALALTAQPTDLTSPIYYGQGFFDVHFTYLISSPQSIFEIRTVVASDLRERVKLAIRYLPFGEQSRAMMITGAPGSAVLNPSWYQAAGSFVILGVEHILSGIDHLLFLFCLVIPFRRLRGLIAVITAFTVAHSVTLIGSAYHLGPAGAWFPPFVETAIAASIVYMAVENIIGPNLRRRWIVTGMFGLVHGFGFSYVLGQQLQFAGSHLLTSLLSFNVGIEVGQLFVLAVTLPALALLRRAVPERTGVIVLSAFIAHSGWHWMTDRWQVLRQAQWPSLEATDIVTLARWVAALLLAFGAAHLLGKWVDRKFPLRAELAERRMDQTTKVTS